MKPIFSADPQAIEKLQKKLAYLERLQEHMKETNKEYKKNGTTNIHPDILRTRARQMEYSYNKGKVYPTWELSNNAAVIRTTRKRIEELTQNNL